MTEQDFWTRDIRLEEISRDEFCALRRAWNDPKPIRYSNTFAKMYNPIAAETYLGLLEKFLKHPRRRAIGLNFPETGWEEFELGEDELADDILDILDMVSTNSSPYNKFDMRFDPAFPDAFGIEERAKIRFRETDNGLIVGDQILVYRGNLGLFDSRISKPSELIISATCHPEDVNY